MLLAIVLTMLFLILGSYYDLRTGEVPDSVTNGLTGLMISYSVFLSLIQKDSGILVETVSIGAVYFLVGYAIYRLGQWGGGDVKMLAGLGCSLGLLNALGFRWIHSGIFHHALTYYINMAFVATPYVIVYGLMLGSGNPETIARFGQYFRKKLALAIFLFSLIPPLLAVLLGFGWLSIFYLVIPAFYIASVYLKAVEHVALQKTIHVSELREEDVVANDIIVDGEKIASSHNIDGLTIGQISRLKELAEKGRIPGEIRIKWGIRFIPILLLAFVITIWTGNMLEIFFNYVFQ